MIWSQVTSIYEVYTQYITDDVIKHMVVLTFLFEYHDDNYGQFQICICPIPSALPYIVTRGVH